MIAILKRLLTKNYAVATLFGLLAFNIFMYIWVFGVNILYLDEWAFARLVENYQSKGWSFTLLFEQHNEHRLFFPRIFYLLTVPISNMNSLFYMHFNAIMIGVAFLLLYSVAKRQFQFTSAQIPVWLIILPLFIFNLRQWENLIWTFQIAFYIVLISSIATFYLIEKMAHSQVEKHNVLYALTAISFGIIATFSSAMGFLVWIAGSIQLAIHLLYSKKKTVSYFLAAFVIVGVLAFRFYLKDLEVPMNNNFSFALSHPFKFLHFFFCLISLTSIKSLSIIALPIGIFLFAISLFAIYKAYHNNRLEENSFWLAIFLFSTLFALLTSVGRAPFSFEFTDRSRYTTFTLLISISSFMLVYDNYVFANKNSQKKLIKMFFCCLIILGIELNAVGLVYGYLNKKARLQSKEIVLNYKTRSMEELKEIDPWLPDEFIEEVEKAVPFVDEHKYNVFKRQNIKK